MRDLAADPSVVGRTLPIGPFAYTVIGVAPPGFAGADLEEPDLWLPIQQAAPLLSGADALRNRGWYWLSILARLAPGVSPAAAAAEANLTYRRVAAASDRPSDTLSTVLLGPIQAARGPDMSSDARVALWIGLVALAVLLVACANVANLLLARGMRRRAEVAVRAGLGASRGGLVRQLMVESLVLALGGAVAGLFVALWGGAAVRTFLLPEGAAAGSLVDPRVLGFTAAAAVAVAALAGGAPAWQASRVDLASALRSGARDVAAGRRLLRSLLLATQVALTLVLLVGGGLFVRSLHHAETLDYGFDVQHLLGASVDLRGGGEGAVQITRNDAGPGGEVVDAQSALYLRLAERLSREPAVAGVAATAGSPFQSVYAVRVRASGRDSLPRVASGGPYVVVVTPGYFATMGTRILRGRGFTETDARGAPPVTVVSRTFARLVWPNRAAIGECLFLGASGDSTCVQVVGVAADARESDVTGDAPLLYYVPFAQHLARLPLDGLLIRTRGPADAVQGEIQHALQTAVPGLPYVSVQSLLDRVEPQWRSWRLGATMLSVFGLLALAIASLGLYGVTAYGVAQRTREIGVRIALGAAGTSVVRLAVGEAMQATAIGGAVGLVIALGLARAVSSLLFGVKPLDPASLGGGLAVLLAVAAVAAYLPARRAAAIDPMEALRTE
jgi:predicted permease